MIISKRSKVGFTLIELLIVIAIIAILAAIAIPNFLAAQTRSKVSKAKKEMQTLATALEAYFVDYNRYPMWYWGPGTNIPVSKRLNRLTTPIAYISAIPKPDPFYTSHDPYGLGPAVYDTYDYCDEQTHAEYNFSWRPGLYGHRWRLCSAGPNRIQNFAWEFYDPTNGLVSNGDIIRLGPRGAFPATRFNEYWIPDAP